MIAGKNITCIFQRVRGGFLLRMEGGQADQWELSKENIQPLKQGRSVMKLNNALEQHKDDESAKIVLEERQHFEEELRSYNGEDPLDPWYRYIQVRNLETVLWIINIYFFKQLGFTFLTFPFLQWVEQTYPKGGKEGQVHVIIEKCIKKFKGEASVQVR